ARVGSGDAGGRDDCWGNAVAEFVRCRGRLLGEPSGGRLRLSGERADRRGGGAGRRGGGVEPGTRDGEAIGARSGREIIGNTLFALLVSSRRERLPMLRTYRAVKFLFM